MSGNSLGLHVTISVFCLIRNIFKGVVITMGHDSLVCLRNLPLLGASF